MNAMTEFENQLFSERMKQTLHEFSPEVVLSMIQVWDASVPQRETLRLLEPDETLGPPTFDDLDKQWAEANWDEDWDEDPLLIPFEDLDLSHIGGEQEDLIPLWGDENLSPRVVEAITNELSKRVAPNEENQPPLDNSPK